MWICWCIISYVVMSKCWLSIGNATNTLWGIFYIIMATIVIISKVSMVFLWISDVPYGRCYSISSMGHTRNVSIRWMGEKSVIKDHI